MNFKKLFLIGCLSVGASLGVNAQIINATQSETVVVNAAVEHTGLAIAPNLDVQAATFSLGNTWRVYWYDGASGALLDADGGNGADPDVAYSTNADQLAVVYEDGGNIRLHRYSLTSLSPVDYNLSATMNIGTGSYANVDINTSGYGVVSWESGGFVWVRVFKLGSMNFGPPVAINPGTQPDAILLDDDKTLALTYVDFNGDLVIETMYMFPAASGVYSPIGQWGYSGMVGYEFPRIGSQRNSNFGAAEDFCVVAQDHNGSTSEVHAIFANAAAPTVGPIVVNSNFLSCNSADPYPVVAYTRGRVRIAWNQRYGGGCSGLSQTSPNNENDVLVKSFGPTGFTSASIQEVNLNPGGFAAQSRSSLASEYDGDYLVNNSNWHEGAVFFNLNRTFWKTRDAATPSYIEEQDLITEERGNNFSLVTSPVDQTIEVLSESDDLASFQLLDNAGRVVELSSISSNNNVYSIDISHLSGGMYFLNCSSNAGQQVLRVLQVNR